MGLHRLREGAHRTSYAVTILRDINDLRRDAIPNAGRDSGRVLAVQQPLSPVSLTADPSALNPVGTDAFHDGSESVALDHEWSSAASMKGHSARR